MLYRNVIAVYLGILRKLFSLLKQVAFRIRYLGVRGPGLHSRYIATLWGIESRWRRDFQTRSESHPASYTMGTGSFPRLKRPGRGVDHPSPSSADDK